MAAIALRRGGSFSSASGSSDFGGSSTADMSVGSGMGGGGGVGSGAGGFLAAGHASAGPGAGLYGSTLASLEYQYQEPPIKRRHSLARNESQSTLGDDLSLLGECDVSSIRSDKHRPGRRASLSAAIELTRSPPPKRSTPKRTTSGSRPFGGRRNSLFGNNGGKDKDKDKEGAVESSSSSKPSKKSGSRRASMAGYPAAAGTVEEPEPTPQFFHSRKKDKHSRNLPNRRKSSSFDKNDPRAVEITSRMRPGGKIKRPGKGGRRASMGAIPGRLGMTKSGSKSSINSKGSQRSVISSNSNSSSYDVSDDEEYYGIPSSSGGGAAAPFRRTVTAPAPQRSSSYGTARNKRDYHHNHHGRKGATTATSSDHELGYGDPEEYDPQLPPPPPPGANKQKVFINRRGSTGTAVSSFPTNLAAQRSLKESLQWKATTGATLHVPHHQHHHHHHHQQQHHLRSSTKSQRRGSTASSVPSVTNSVATDKVNNTEGARCIDGGGGPSDVPPSPSSSKAHPRVPADVPPGGRRVPADVPPGKKRVPLDIPPPAPHAPSTPQQHDKPSVDSLLNSAPLTPLNDDSESSYEHNYGTPLQSNRKTHRGPGGVGGGRNNNSSYYESPSSSSSSCVSSSQHLSMMGNSSALGSSSALGLMSDESDGSHGDGATSGLNMMDRRRASRGLSVLQKVAPPPVASAVGGGRHRGSSMLGGSSLGGSFNPYGNNNRDSDEEEEEEEEDEQENEKDKDDDDDDEDEETEEDKAENQKMADFGSEAGDIVAVTAASTTDTTPTLGTMTSTEESSVGMENDDNKKNKDDDKKDDDSVDSMTSEAPQEKAPEVVDVDELADSQKQKQEVDIMEEIGATGDWSQGVQEHLLHQPQTTNSLLDRYPGSDYGYEGADLGYGYSHLGQSQQPKILNAYDDESERKEDYEYDFDNGYGPSDLYDEDYSSFGWREHRPRAADSIEFINMEQLMSKAKSTKGLYLPTFIPAHGCTNASDFIVRCFVARLRAGVTVTKHSRSRFCKSHDRILHILPTGYHITWIPEVEEEAAEGKKTKTKKPPTKLDLTKCLEVRHAWSRDPKSMRYTGTSTLRSKCKEGAANRSFALIYPHRTVDFTAMTVDQCKILMEGFSALCFRLQMAKLEQQSGEEDTQRSAISGMDHDNDSTTASLTGTNMSAPWGL